MAASRTRGRIRLRKSPTDLARVIAAAVENSRPLIAATRHQLTLAMPPMPLPVKVDATRLAQAFSSLLDNAASHTDSGGRIALAVRSEDADAVVTVTDTGAGIAPETLPMVFDLFNGLARARALVEMHGGSVTARSEGHGCGSEFEVRVPLGAQRPAPERAQPAPEVRGLPRVLVVDDNHDAADSLGAVLERLGAEVRVTHDGAAALDTFASFHPAAVFLDLGMPGMDGYEVASRMRKGAAASEALLIALTGWGTENDRRRAVAAGFNHHLVKPAEIGTLRALLASLPASPK
jgi:CheY-like chemotaxis protein